MTDASSAGSQRTGAWIIWGSVAILAVAHQDLWFWDDRTLVLGFLPIGLAYHAGFSIVAASVWALSTRLIWPHRLEAWAEESVPESSGVPSAGSATGADPQQGGEREG